MDSLANYMSSLRMTSDHSSRRYSYYSHTSSTSNFGDDESSHYELARQTEVPYSRSTRSSGARDLRALPEARSGRGDPRRRARDTDRGSAQGSVRGSARGSDRPSTRVSDRERASGDGRERARGDGRERARGDGRERARGDGREPACGDGRERARGGDHDRDRERARGDYREHASRRGHAWVRRKAERGLFKSKTLEALFGGPQKRRRSGA